MFPRLSELTAITEAINESSHRREGDLADMIEKYRSKNGLTSMEGYNAERKFVKLTSVMGYRDMDSFLSDNPGAIEAMVEWISSMRSAEWVESLKNEIGSGDEEGGDEGEKDDDDEEEDLDLGELVQKWCDVNRAWSFEGERGIRNITKLVGALGYGSFDEFMGDNSGAIEAMVEWIGTQRIPEWIEAFKNASAEESEDGDR